MSELALDRIRENGVALLLVVLLMTVPFPVWCMEKDMFLKEVSGVPRVSGTNRTNIDHVVEKYIHGGMDLQKALSYLKSLGFEIHPYRGQGEPSGQKWFIAERNESYRVILTETTRVIVESDGARVLKTRGWVFLKGI